MSRKIIQFPLYRALARNRPEWILPAAELAPWGNNGQDLRPGTGLGILLCFKTQSRQVWKIRKGLVKRPTGKENQPETEQSQEGATEPDSVETNKEIG